MNLTIRSCRIIHKIGLLLLIFTLITAGQPAQAEGVRLPVPERSATTKTGTISAATNTIVVNTATDEDTANSACSLREAIIAAEANGNYHGCTGTGAYGADTITFAGNYTITLAGSQLPSVGSEITITGNGAAKTIIQANAAPNTATYRIFEVTNAGKLILDGLTVRNGNCYGSCHSPEDFGGGVTNNGGTLIVVDSTFTGNHAMGGSAINNRLGTTMVMNSIFSGNSAINGAISNYSGTLSVTDSTFFGNFAEWGGALFLYDAATSGTCASVSATIISNSTFNENSAVGGGGIYNAKGVITLLFNTITANAGGGVLSENDSKTCTKAGSNIIAENTGYDVGAFSTAQRFYSHDHNLIGVAGDNIDFTQEFNQPYDQVNVVDPMLGTLANYGGPTQTVALLPGSPAIDAGDNTACATSPINSKDQRGVARPQGISCDIGAFEFATQSGRNLIVTSNADSDDGLCESLPGGCTLREAINAANAISGSNVLTFAGNYTITLAGSQLPAVSSDVIITGKGAANTIIQANAAPNIATHRVFEVTNTGDLTLVGLTVRNGLCTDSCEGSQNGGGIRNSGTLMVTNSTVSGSSAELGGGIYNYGGGTLTVTNSTFSGNSASRGGGINNNLGTLTVTNSTFSGNSGSYGGGSIYNATATGACTSASASTISNSTFSGNSADDGGGIYNYNGVITLRFNTITANSSGGGVFSYNSSTTCTKAGSNIIAGNAEYDVGANSTTQRFSSLDYNLIGVAGANVNFTLEFNKTNDQVNVTNPMLGVLANNGGPTQTVALLPSSPAIDAGDDAACATAPINNKDQRGATRPFGSHCDIGAYELNEQLLNGGFNTYPVGKKIPTSWKAVNFSTTDGKVTTVKQEGTASVRIIGTGVSKTLSQTLLLSGSAGDAFNLSFWVKGKSIPTTTVGYCRAQVLFYNGTKLNPIKPTINCAKGTYAFNQKALAFTAPGDYTKIVVKFIYSKASGTAWFDAVSLTR